MPLTVLRFLCWTMGGVLILLLGLVLLVFVKVPQAAPLVVKPATLYMDDGSFSSLMLGRAELRQAFRGEAVTVSLNAQEINALMQDLSRRMLGAAGHVNLSEGQAEVMVTLPLTEGFLGRTPLKALALRGGWLNARATVLALPEGPPQLASVRLGGLPVPPWLALWVARGVAAHYQLAEPLDIALSSVERVTMARDGAQVRLRWHPESNTRVIQLLVPTEDQERLTAYQRQLAELMGPLDPNAPPPFAHFGPPLALPEVLKPMFEQAQQRTLAQSLGADAAQIAQTAARENRAVLMVLALHVGQVPVSHLLPGAASEPALTAFRQRPLTLHGRPDFAQHYVMSALLANDVGGRLADAIGMFKEMLDTRDAHRGSGFSFNDLAADRAGTRFGQRARTAPGELQRRVVQGQDDAFFMPAVDDLPQFLSEQQFRAMFGQVGSASYNALMREIDRRVNEAPVLR